MPHKNSRTSLFKTKYTEENSAFSSQQQVLNVPYQVDEAVGFLVEELGLSGKEETPGQEELPWLVLVQQLVHRVRQVQQNLTQKGCVLKGLGQCCGTKS